MAKVKFLRYSEIENATLCLLAEYGRKYGDVVAPPVPVEEILEAHLALTLDFDDLGRRIGVPDVLGATWIQDKLVLVDQSLDPTENPPKEGRYRFTLAHELGHWELHRHHFLADAGQPSLFGDKPKPSIVCRTSSRKEPMEWQADCFAGYLLMPEDRVFRVWEQVYGSAGQYVAFEEIEQLKARWGDERLGDTTRYRVGSAGEMTGACCVAGGFAPSFLG